MESMEREPAYIAKQVKFIRKMFRLTQENLAEMSGLTTRTIEKVESGRHRPDEQTLRSIARCLHVDVAYFEKPTPEQEARQLAEIERAVRKMLVVPTIPIRSTSDFLGEFRQRHAFRFDSSQVKDDEALEVAASLIDNIKDLNDCWNDCSASDQLQFARNCMELVGQLEKLGYVCQMGHHKQVLHEKERPDLVFVVGLLCIQSKSEADGRRYAIVELEGRWEKVSEDRMQFAKDPQE